MSVKFSNSYYNLSIIIYNSIEQINMYRLYIITSGLKIQSKEAFNHSNYDLKN